MSNFTIPALCQQAVQKWKTFTAYTQLLRGKVTVCYKLWKHYTVLTKRNRAKSKSQGFDGNGLFRRMERHQDPTTTIAAATAIETRFTPPGIASASSTGLTSGTGTDTGTGTASAFSTGRTEPFGELELAAASTEQQLPEPGAEAPVDVEAVTAIAVGEGGVEEDERKALEQAYFNLDHADQDEFATTDANDNDNGNATDNDPVVEAAVYAALDAGDYSMVMLASADGPPVTAVALAKADGAATGTDNKAGTEEEEEEEEANFSRVSSLNSSHSSHDFGISSTSSSACASDNVSARSGAATAAAPVEINHPDPVGAATVSASSTGSSSGRDRGSGSGTGAHRPGKSSATSSNKGEGNTGRAASRYAQQDSTFEGEGDDDSNGDGDVTSTEVEKQSGSNSGNSKHVSIIADPIARTDLDTGTGTRAAGARPAAKTAGNGRRMVHRSAPQKPHAAGLSGTPPPAAKLQSRSPRTAAAALPPQFPSPSHQLDVSTCSYASHTSHASRSSASSVIKSPAERKAHQAAYQAELYKRRLEQVTQQSVEFNRAYGARAAHFLEKEKPKTSLGGGAGSGVTNKENKPKPIGRHML